MDVIQGQGKFLKNVCNWHIDVVANIVCGYFYYWKNLLQVFWMLLGSNGPIFDENIVYYHIGVDINLDKIVVTNTLIFVSTVNRIYKKNNYVRQKKAILSTLQIPHYINSITTS